jgi:hypothetical protein
MLAEQQANHALDASRGNDQFTRFRRLVADDQADTALDTAEQQLAIYASVAAAYACFAAAVFDAATSETLSTVEAAQPVPPSRILADPAAALPLVQLPAATDADDDSQNEQLQQAYHRIVAAARVAVASRTATSYDGRAAAARPAPRHRRAQRRGPCRAARLRGIDRGGACGGCRRRIAVNPALAENPIRPGEAGVGDVDPVAGRWGSALSAIDAA